MQRTLTFLDIASQPSSLVPVPEEFRSSLLNREMSTIPSEFFVKICSQLESVRKRSSGNWILIGKKLGIRRDDISRLAGTIVIDEETYNPSCLLMQMFLSQKDHSIGKFASIGALEQVASGVLSVLNEWITYEWKICCISSGAFTLGVRKKHCP